MLDWNRFTVLAALLVSAWVMGTSVAKGEAVGPIGPTVTISQFNNFKVSVDGQISLLSDKLDGLNASVQDLSRAVIAIRQTPYAQPVTNTAALTQTVQQKVESALANKIKSEVSKEVASATGSLTEQVGQLQQKLEANGSGVDQKITPLASQLAQLNSDVETLRMEPVRLPSRSAVIPPVIWVLLGVNLLFGGGALGAALFILKGRN